MVKITPEMSGLDYTQSNSLPRPLLPHGTLIKGLGYIELALQLLIKDL